MTRERYFGKPIRRREDFRYLTGRGTYTSEVRVPNPLHMKVVRSVYPHARIRRISTEATMRCPGVVTVLSAQAPLGIRHLDTPMTPNKMWIAMEAARVHPRSAQGEGSGV